MNIDYSKVSFNELDMEYPLQAFFNYETTQEEISEWLANEVTCDEIPEEINIMGMEIEVIGKTYYTVHLDDEDVKKVKQWIKDHEEDLPSFDTKENICAAVMDLYSDGQIDLYSDDKATESDFSTEEINWSEYEKRSAEKILNE